jgi:hypothetical protein
MDRPSAKDRGSGDRAAAAPSAGLPYEKAFVVQFTAETGASLEPIAGRVEHLLTGRRSRFASIEEFLACIEALLASSTTAPSQRGGAGTKKRRRRADDAAMPPPSA